MAARPLAWIWRRPIDVREMDVRSRSRRRGNFEAARSRLSYANAMATLAVFIALGGSAYAVGRHTIGTKELKRGAVGTAQLKSGAVTSPKIAAGSVTAEKIADGVSISGPRGENRDPPVLRPGRPAAT